MSEPERQRHILVVYSQGLPGTDDAYNDWYSNRHLQEVLRVDGFVSAQRFRICDTDPAQEAPLPYLAIYEIDGDAKAALDALAADAPNREEMTTLDRGATTKHLFTALTERLTKD